MYKIFEAAFGFGKKNYKKILSVRNVTNSEKFEGKMLTTRLGVEVCIIKRLTFISG